MRRPCTPFFTPRSKSSSSPGRSASLKHSTSAPQRRNGICSRSQSFGIAWLPSTLNRAMSEPGRASKPAWTMAEFALDVPVHTSSPASITAARSEYLPSSIAVAQPTTPAPTTRTSYCIAFPSLYRPAHGSCAGRFFYWLSSGGPSRASTAVKYSGSGDVSSMCSPVRGWINLSVRAWRHCPSRPFSGFPAP